MNATPEVRQLARAAPARVLACGAYLKNRACLIDGRSVLWSPVHGDLGDPANRIALERSTEALLAAASGPPQAVAHDLHPEFHSTQAALVVAQRLAVPAIAVQHHHAHIGVALAEQDARPGPLDPACNPVIGLALDGMGLGDDGDLWGGELLWVHGARTAHRWRRLDHLPPLPLPGGDAAAREPWRMAAAALHELGRGDEIEARYATEVGVAAARTVRAMLQRDLLCPRGSSAGRWFDAAAAALGLCLRQRSEAEAALALEALARGAMRAQAQPEPDPGAAWPDLLPCVGELFKLAALGREGQARGALRFHRVLAAVLARRACELAHECGAQTIVFGGGCFANEVLREYLVASLHRAGLQVLQPRYPGVGDAGLALGQAWVAACAVRAGASVQREQAQPPAVAMAIA